MQILQFPHSSPAALASYTQVSDVEDEVNGLFTYDRAAIKPDPAAVRAVNQALEAAFEKIVE